MSLISHTAGVKGKGVGSDGEMSRLRDCVCVCVAWQLISNGNCANKLTNLRATFTPRQR